MYLQFYYHPRLIPQTSRLFVATGDRLVSHPFCTQQQAAQQRSIFPLFVIFGIRQRLTEGCNQERSSRYRCRGQRWSKRQSRCRYKQITLYYNFPQKEDAICILTILFLKLYVLCGNMIMALYVCMSVCTSALKSSEDKQVLMVYILHLELLRVHRFSASRARDFGSHPFLTYTARNPQPRPQFPQHQDPEYPQPH